jgi:hypothetical protein
MLKLEDAVKMADLVIGAVLVPGAKAPKLVTNSTVAHMKPGAVLVDIAIDQGGCFEDSRPTTHDDPTFAVHDTLFYCVANMPGAVPRTSTYALTNATMPYVHAVALGMEGRLPRRSVSREGPLHARWRVAVRAGGSRPRPPLHRFVQRAGLTLTPRTRASQVGGARVCCHIWGSSPQR